MPHAEPVPDAPLDQEPNTLSTPEGDNEFAPDQPLTGSSVDAEVEGLQTPRGNAPQPYDNDRANPGTTSRSEADRDEHDEHKPTGLEKVIDEVSHGTLMP